MNNIKFIITDDSSMGLYNESVNDIYHSKTGAYTEALKKFILPSMILSCKTSSWKKQKRSYDRY